MNIRTKGSHYRLHNIDWLHPARSACSVQFKLQALSHQDRDLLSSRKAAAVYDILKANQFMVWRRHLDKFGVKALECRKQRDPNMKPEQQCPAAENAFVSDTAQALH